MALTVDNCAVVYLNMRMLGHGRNGHILQLAAKFADGKSLAVWIEPSRYVSENASEIDGLEARYGKLFYYNDFLPTVPLEVAMRKMLMFLNSSLKPVVIVCHAGQFIFVLLLQAIMETDMIDQFDNVVVGFSDSLPRFIEKFPTRKGPGKFELESLANDILKEKYEEKFLEAPRSLEVLERLVNSCSLTASIIEHHICFEKSLCSEMGAQYSYEIVESLIPLRGIITIGLVKKFAEAAVSYSSLVKMYQEQGVEKLKKFLSEKQANGKPRITEPAAVHEKIIAFLQKTPKSPAASRNVQVDVDMPEINKDIPIYSQIDPFKKRQDRINREIDLLRQQQEQDYANVDLLRRPDPYHVPVDRYKRPLWRLYENVNSAKNSPSGSQRLGQNSRSSSGLYETIDPVQTRAPAARSGDRYSGPSSGLYETIDPVQTRAPAARSGDRYSGPSSGLYEDINSVQTRAPVARSDDRYSGSSSGLYEDINSVQIRAPVARSDDRYSGSSSGLYDNINSVQTRAAVPRSSGQYSGSSSGLYENIDSVQTRAAGPRSGDRYSGPSSGLYENIDSIQTRAPGPRSGGRYSGPSSGLYEDPDAYKEPAAEEPVEFRTKRNSQVN